MKRPFNWYSRFFRRSVLLVWRLNKVWWQVLNEYDFREGDSFKATVFITIKTHHRGGKSRIEVSEGDHRTSYI